MRSLAIEKMAQEMAKETGKPVEVCRAGLLAMAAAMGEVFGVPSEQVAYGRRRASEILTAHEQGARS